MGKRFEFDLYAGGMVDDDPEGLYVLHSDYAALLASHARLLASVKELSDALQAEGSGYAWDRIDRADVAIAAAQPFTEKTND